METYSLTAHGLVAIGLIIGLMCIVFTPGTQLNIYVFQPFNFRTLDRAKRSWLATAADVWHGLPADVILQREVYSWCTILKDVQCCICT